MIKNDTISSHVKISMISLISSLSLKLYLNSLVYHRNIFGSSSHVLDNLRKPSDIFRDFRKMFGIVRLAFGTNLENLRKSSESDRRSLENHQNRHHEYVYIIKRTFHVSSKIWILLLLPLEHRIHTFSRHRVMSSMNVLCVLQQLLFSIFFSCLQVVLKHVLGHVVTRTARKSAAWHRRLIDFNYVVFELAPKQDTKISLQLKMN